MLCDDVTPVLSRSLVAAHDMATSMQLLVTSPSRPNECMSTYSNQAGPVEPFGWRVSTLMYSPLPGGNTISDAFLTSWSSTCRIDLMSVDCGSTRWKAWDPLNGRWYPPIPGPVGAHLSLPRVDYDEHIVAQLIVAILVGFLALLWGRFAAGSSPGRRSCGIGQSGW